ncbi:hypothetical protein CISG_04709 [Coccidioides immitis RMSCC 3703]|uniref:Uncharacterized protein n=1 Tax=Coccidioides immitis RMSCC 3703 TaxID=454286 RepID=A0A0J8QTB0_COCIT|nr:hypothetical protein CISG_04709 [Coccidioides immitis RMSCC 3703]
MITELTGFYWNFRDDWNWPLPQNFRMTLDHHDPAGQGSNDRNRNIPGFETGLTPTVCAQALEVLHPLPLRFTFFVLVQNSKITVIFQDDAVALVPTIATLVCHATKSALVQ